ncbi:alpha/beta hydrolase [Kordia jejudonensis]|uniref:alpha/beta hydrolase n=1 Tax=Kordia jejudonensis TaxID=1348245 RepID=UPI0006290B2F|nr:alpha/beta hydrolase [Kordia jejudonensis]
MKTPIIFIFFALLTIISCSKNDDTLEVNLTATELLNVSYGTNENQTFDLFLPENRSQTSTKTIVLIHGGGWTSGDKADLITVYDYFKTNTNEYAIVNLNYTLADLNTSPIPLQTNDINFFIQYFKENASEYNVNPEFAFIGTSAGAHLSMLYGYKYDEDKDVKVICNIVGPTDFLHESYLNTSEPETTELITNVQTLYGMSIAENIEFYESISPFYAVNEFSPATISFYGDEDFLVPEEQGIILKEALDNYNIPNEYILYEGEGHGWGNPNFLHTLQKIEVFLTANFN